MKSVLNAPNFPPLPTSADATSIEVALASTKTAYEAPRVLKKQALTRVTLASTFNGSSGSFTSSG